MTNSWKTAPFIIIFKKGRPTNPVDSFLAIPGPGARGRAGWVAMSFSFEAGTVIIPQRDSQELLGSTRTQSPWL